MLLDRVAPSIFAAVLLFACSDSNLGTGTGLSLGGDGGSGGDGGTSSGGDGGTNTFLESGQCPPVGSSICPNDTPATQADVDSCTKALSDPTCGNDYKSYLECAGANVTCDSTGQSDSSAIETACSSQVKAYTSCVSPASGVDGG
jgi:hypothetical protein